MRIADVNWDDHVQQLRRLWLAGKSCAQIAAELGHGITRNAVIGKVHRLKIADRHCQSKAGGRPPAQARSTPGVAPLTRQKPAPPLLRNAVRLRRNPLQVQRAAARAGILAPKPPSGNVLLAFAHGYNGQQGRVALVDLEPQHCRFPVDMPDGAVHYCGLAKEISGSYCPAHAVRCVAGGGSS
jgi:GcrA cell cycle regulator